MLSAILGGICQLLIAGLATICVVAAWHRKFRTSIAAMFGAAVLAVILIADPSWPKIVIVTVLLITNHFVWKWAKSKEPVEEFHFRKAKRIS